MTPAKRQIVLVNLAHFVTHYSLLILATAVLAIVIQAPGRFGADYGDILKLGTGMFVLYGACSIAMTWLSAKLGSKALMVIFFFGTGTCLAAAGIAGTPVVLALSLAGAGAFLSIYHPIGTATLVEAAGERVGASVGVNGVFGNLGVAAAPIVTAFLAGTGHWRWAFLAPAVLCLVGGLLYWREPAFDSAKARAAAKPFPEIPAAVVRRAVIIMLTIAACSGLVFNSFTLVLPKLMQERMAGSPDLLPLVGSLAFVATLFGGLTQFTVGRMIDRFTLRRVFLPLAAIQVPTFLALWQAPGWVVLPLAALVAASIFGQVTVNDTMTARYIAPPLRVKLYSYRFFVGFLGAALASPIIAWLYDLAGNVGLTILLMVLFGGITFTCALFFPDRPEELAVNRPPAAPAAPGPTASPQGA